MRVAKTLMSRGADQRGGRAQNPEHDNAPPETPRKKKQAPGGGRVPKGSGP